MSVLHWLYEFGLDVLLGIEPKIYFISQMILESDNLFCKKKDKP